MGRTGYRNNPEITHNSISYTKLRCLTREGTYARVSAAPSQYRQVGPLWR